MTERSEMAVIGAGIVGLSTAYSLAERGAGVTVYERGVPGNGQSGGDSRLFRHAHDDPRLVRLASRSRALWTEWETRLGVELVSTDGVVALGPSAQRRLGVVEGVGGVAARAIDPAEVHERLPLLAHYTGPAALDEAGGSIRTPAAIEALSGRLEASIVADEVISVRPVGGGGVEVRAGGACARYPSVVVCAGQGTAQLARGVGLSLPVNPAAHVRNTFAVAGDPPSRLACLQDSSDEFGETGIYGAPLPGNRHYALGLSQTVDVHEDGSLVDPAALAELSERASGYVRRALPGLDPQPVDYRHCWVTEVPWSDDGFAVWEADGIFFVAGHNLFKQAPALGDHLARAALGEGLDSELRPEAKLGAPA
ncbi:MAG TPA: FAD-dependent oxidoreductase [Acidimicrobiales bacterium]|nr:FAD-dependent oxidoreductase [Acidimicrobiales bacterium]